MRRFARAVLSAVVVLFVATTAGGAAALALTTPPARTAPVPATHTLAHARTDCHVDEYDQLGLTTGGRWTDLAAPALACLLTATGAPADLAADVVDRSPGTWTRQWDTTTATWSASWRWGPDGYVITIRLDPKDPQR